MDFKFNGTSPTGVKYNNQDVGMVKFNNSVVWAKPYTLTIQTSLPTGVVSLTVTRTASYVAGTGALSNGATIYHGDTLSVTATPHAAYTNPTTNINSELVTGNVSVTVTAGTVKEVYISSDWDTVAELTVSRISSPYGGASTGTLFTGGAATRKIYYGDKIQVVFSKYYHNVSFVSGGTTQWSASDQQSGSAYPTNGFGVTADTTIIARRNIVTNRVIWSGTKDLSIQNNTAWYSWWFAPSNYVDDASDLKFDGVFDFRGTSQSFYQANMPISYYLKYSGTSASTITAKDASLSGYRFESSGNNFPGTARFTKVYATC